MQQQQYPYVSARARLLGLSKDTTMSLLLLEAAGKGDKAQVEACLHNFADPNTRIPNALFESKRAALEGRRGTVLHALSSVRVTPSIYGRILGAARDIHQIDDYHRTPLHLLAARGDAENARQILALGGLQSLKGRDLDALRPEDQAMKSGHVKLASLLSMERERQEAAGRRPLDDKPFASRDGHEDRAKIKMSKITPSTPAPVFPETLDILDRYRRTLETRGAKRTTSQAKPDRRLAATGMER